MGLGWFDSQIRQRKQSDQERFEDSILRMASVVVGNRYGDTLADDRIITKHAIDDILKYYHCKPVDIPESLTEPEEQLEYALRPYGLMYRVVELKENWYKDGFGPVIAFREEDGVPIALFPKELVGYYYRDSNGSKISVNKKNMEGFSRDAICFYRPLPLRSIGIPDLLLFMKNCLNIGDLIIVFGFNLLCTLMGLLMPGITKMMAGFVLESGKPSLLWGTAVFMLCVAVSTRLIEIADLMAGTRLEIKTSIPVDSAMMMRIMSLPASFFKKYSAGELSSRSDAVNQLCSLLMGTALSAGLTSFTSLLYITKIFQYTPALTVPAVLVVLSTVVIMILTSLMQIRRTRDIMECSVKESGLTYALISGVQKIKLAGAEKRAFAKWADTYSKGAALTYNPPIFIKINSTIQTAVTLAGTIVIYYTAVTTRVSPAEYMAFNAAYGMLMGAFTSMAGTVLQVAQIKPVLEMAEPFLKAEPEMSDGREILTRLSGAIELNNVYFRYNEDMPYVVDGLSLKIRPGEYIAIVGKTGCGKSTLVRLLLGFEKAEKGGIYFDGKDINKVDLRSLRRKIGTVTQDGGLFQGDIYSNIVISAPHLTLDDAWKAAEMAGIADDIRAMPMGMQTLISEGQGGISGGQKQRIMIARAIAPGPKILIFDEATSALDNKTQRQVSEALDGLKCTRIVIAHRLSTIKNCDRILVLNQGKILEEGTYEQLIDQNGYFAQLVERQRLDV